MDDVQVSKALADRALDVNPPTGYPAFRTAHAFPPESFGATPALVVIPGSDSIEVGGQTRRTTVTYTVRLYLDTIADMARRYEALAAYRTWVRDLYNGAVTLGGLVDQAGVTATQTSTDEVGGIEYLVVDATVECVKQEAVAYTA
jgi:hypothetical protein